MQRSGLRGCDSCSALLYPEDVFCPTCGAGVQEAETRAGTVRIPIRRHGVVPPMPTSEGPVQGGGGMRGAVVGLALTMMAAGATAAVIYGFW